jgi:hypothetical protein
VQFCGEVWQLATVVAAVAVAVVASGSAMGATPSDRRPEAPTGLTVDDDAAPLAVTDAPTFGWIVNDPDRNDGQQAYELIVSDAPTARTFR